MISPEIGYFAEYKGKWYEILRFDEDLGTQLSNFDWVCASKFTNIKKSTPFACPICGNQIKVNRIDDGETFYIVDKTTGKITKESNYSNGYTKVFCGKEESHELGSIEKYILNQL